MAGRSRPKRAKVRGNSIKAQFAAGLADIISETTRLWRKHHLGYDQTKYVVEQARRRCRAALKTWIDTVMFSIVFLDLTVPPHI